MESRKQASALAHVAIVGLGLLAAGPAAAQPAPPPPAPAATVEAPRPPRDIESRAGRAEYCTDRARKVLAQRAAGVASDAVPTLEQSELDGMHLRCFDNAKSGPTSGAADLGAEVLRSVAQVVLNRAMRAGWTLLETELRDAAECDAPATTSSVRFPSTCRVLGTVAKLDLAHPCLIPIDWPSTNTAALTGVVELLEVIADERGEKRLPALQLTELNQRERKLAAAVVSRRRH